jgi:DNA-directed RNA polymerase specialized sigma subunit
LEVSGEGQEAFSCTLTTKTREGLFMRPINLSKPVLDNLCLIMSVGNSALKECAEMMGMEDQEFRGQFFRGTLDTSKLTAEQLVKLEKSKPLIHAVRNKCETTILEGFDRMVHRQASAAAAHNVDKENVRDDFYQAGLYALDKAVFSYTDRSIPFRNYAWQVIRRDIVAQINKSNSLCPLTNEAILLRRNFEQAKQQFNGPVSDEEVVEAMGLSVKERDVLFSSGTKVINEIVNKDVEGDDDYTASRRGVDRDFHAVSAIREEVRQAVKDADLSAFELDCVLTELFPYHGWKEDVASKHINYRTNQRFTRQNVQYALARAKQKIQEVITNPPDTHKQNPFIDKFFDEWSGRHEK